MDGRQKQDEGLEGSGQNLGREARQWIFQTAYSAECRKRFGR